MFREVRLAALKDAPHAFGSTWENERKNGEVEWRAAVMSRSRFIAVAGDRVVGLAAGGDSTYSRTAALTSLWVDPSARGGGVGNELVKAVVEWAREAGFDQVLLWVADGNSFAESLYLRNGFTRTGDVINEPRREFEMSRRI